MPDAPSSEVRPKLFVGGQRFPEGPNFDSSGHLFVCNRWDGFIARVTPGGQRSHFVSTGGKPNGARFHRDGRLFIADIGLREILAANPDGSLLRIVNNFEGRPLLGPNDLIFDRNGSLYFTDPGLGDLRSPGAVFRLSADGGLTLLTSGQLYPNGIALNDLEDTLFVAETGSNRVSRFSIRRDGTLGRERIFVQFAGGQGPDGIAFGVDGNLYVTHRGPGLVAVVDPAGQIIARLPAGGTLPTNLAFWDRSLYVTEDESQAVHRLDIGVGGQTLFHQRERI
jgi:gluconolactonase